MASFLARISWHGDDRSLQPPAPAPRRIGLLLAFVFTLSLGAGAIAPASASAVEQAEEFVKGLQARGLHQLALEYLESLESSPLANDSLRKKIPYLRGVALIEQSWQSSSPALRNSLLDEARQELENFAAQNPHNVQGADAQLQLATVQMKRGQELLFQAKQLPPEKSYDAQRKDLFRQARLQFADARETYQRAETTFNTELEKLPPATGNEPGDNSGTQRQQYRGRVVQLRCLAAQTQFEIACSYAPASDEFKKLNKEAADDLAAIYEEFGRSANSYYGLYAHLVEGRCYQAIGEYAMALGCFEDVLRSRDEMLEELRRTGSAASFAPFRKLVASASQRKAEVLLAQQKPDLAIELCTACLKDADKDEEKQPEWLGVRFRFAEALAKKGAAAQTDSADQKRLLAEAREAYRFVARSPGEFQLAAKTASTATTATTSSGGEAKKKDEPKTFTAAYDLGKEALAAYNAAKLAVPSAQKNNPEAVPELEQQMDEGKAAARHYFDLAATLVDSETDQKQLNEVRYFLCWLNWEAGDFYRAAVLGEFVARHFPDHPAAPSAAKISMASFERLSNKALAAGNKNDTGEFEAGKMAQLAEFIVRRWPGTDDADAAFRVLVSFAIRSGKIDEAENMLGQASEPSRQRLELLLGNALWGRYLEMSQPEQANKIGPEALAKLKASAAKYLRSGYEAAQTESPMSEAGATAALYLVQYLLGESNYADAITLLEDPKSGPLKLITEEQPTATRPQYQVEAYKAALRAYVSVTPPQDKKAMSTMQALEKVVQESGEPGKSAEQLTRIYIGMGLALQKQMEELRTAGNQKEATRVAASFANFVDRVEAHAANANWPTRAWLAQTYYTLGTADSQRAGASPPLAPATASAPLTNTAREQLTKSRDAYEKLLKDVAENPQLAPGDTAVLAAKMQLGECYRLLGQYQQSIDTFASILKDKEASLAVQRAAALAYQERGEREDPQWFEQAIFGGTKSKTTGQNLIWGWLKIAQVAGRAVKQDEKFRDAFYEARYNISLCRYLGAMKLQGDARRQGLTKAKQSVQSLAQLYPDLGGDKWKPQYESLLKDIESEETKPSSPAKK
ncbi:MAG: hypothetical protein U0805_16765 [Pirellulales bacterium]